MPIYHFMPMLLNLESYKKLEAICSVFLWGASSGGNNKKALVAWAKIAVEKAEGGLGFTLF